MQDVFIIPGSVRENILLDKKMDETALGDVLKKAQLRKVIRELPEGLHTRIGEGGRALSAGQKQLLAFGRVLASNPKILVLDEATSNVDSASEALIEEAVTASLSGRTSIIIAHRLSTIKRADQVVVMQDGVILEQGSHEELMARGGYYHRLVRMEYQELLQ
jgi:ATP-binding cassette subfamily B protein